MTKEILRFWVLVFTLKNQAFARVLFMINLCLSMEVLWELEFNPDLRNTAKEE